MRYALGILIALSATLAVVRTGVADDKHDHGPSTRPAQLDEHGHDHAAKPKAGKVDEHGHDHGADEHAGHTDEVKLSEAAIERAGIRVAPAKMQSLAPTLAAPARVAFDAERVAHISAPVRGRVVEIKSGVGKVVKRGDDLLIIESLEFAEAQGDYLQRSAAFSVAESAIEPVKAAAERARTLYEQKQGISLAEVQKRDAEHKAAQGAILTAKASLKAAESKLNVMGLDSDALEKLSLTSEVIPKYVVRAPIAGTVVEREVTLGEQVNPDDEALLALADMRQLWVLADVSESRLPEVQVGAVALVRTAPGSSDAVEGRVALIAPMVDPETRSAKVRIEVAGEESLRPGMFAVAELALRGAGAAQLVVPQDAVQTIEGHSAVFVPVAGEPNTFAARRVETGKSVGGFVPILDGLKDGEPVVVSGTFILKAELGKGEASHSHDH